MADANSGGFLRGPGTSGALGPLIVQGPGGAALGSAAGAVSAPALTTDTSSRVAASASAVTLLAANAARKSGAIYNDSTAILYVKHGASASPTDFRVAVGPSGYYEMPFPLWQGIVTGAWASATGAAQATEGA